MAHRRLKGSTYLDNAITKQLSIAGVVVTAGSTASFSAYNGSGGTLTAGTLVYVSGWNAANNVPQVSKATNVGLISRATYVVLADILNTTVGSIGKQFLFTAQNTNSGNVGDPVYLGTAGGYTLTAPILPTQMQQVLGRITVKNASTGAIQFDISGNVGDAVLGASDIQPGLAPGKWVYDFAVLGGTIGTIPLTGPALPPNFLVYGGLLRVITSPVGAGSSGAIQTEGANDTINAAAISGAPWSTTGTKAIIPVCTAVTSFPTTVARTPSVVISTANWTAGKFDLFLFGFPADG